MKLNIKEKATTKAQEKAFGGLLGGLMNPEVAQKINTLLAEPIIQIKFIHPDAKMPERAYEGDAGIDLFACEEVVIPSKGIEKVRIGFATAVDPNFYVKLVSKSGVAANENLHLVTGTIDPNYREEWFAPMLNMNDKPYTVQKHQKIVQMQVRPIMQPIFKVVDYDEELPETERKGGFASSGKF